MNTSNTTNLKATDMTKDQYLAARKEWANKYNEQSQSIRDLRQVFREAARVYSSVQGASSSYNEEMRKADTALMNARRNYYLAQCRATEMLNELEALKNVATLAFQHKQALKKLEEVSS